MPMIVRALAHGGRRTPFARQKGALEAFFLQLSGNNGAGGPTPPPLKDRLMERPPFRFVKDIVTAVQQQTG
jgi:hypothetical protein